jgi:L-asparaginase
MWRYETGVHLLELGVVSGYDMTTEAAVTKLMYLLANCSSVDEVKANLNKSLQGEIHI